MNDTLSELDSLFEESDRLDDETSLLFDNMREITQETSRIEEITTSFSDYVDDINVQFSEKTKLTKSDMPFLALATGLQTLRQALFLKPRMDDKTAASSPHEQNKDINNLLFGKHDATDSKKFYYASLGDILDIHRPVPYDITDGSKAFLLGGNGGLSSDHRFKVPGHDPILGLLYGTANITTNTITSYYQISAHVKYIQTENRRKPTIYAQANTLSIFNALAVRIKEDPTSVAAALIKQIYHIKADEYSEMGIPIPLVGKFNPSFSRELADYGLDWVNFKQFGIVCIIDWIIASLHRLLYSGSNYELNLYKCRTKKILEISNGMADIANLLYVGSNLITGNKQAIKQLDLAGLLCLSLKIINDQKFFSRVKKEYLDNEIDRIMGGNK